MSNAQKTPFARFLPQLAIGNALDQIAQLGLGVPGHVVSISGAIVTVAFDVTGLTLPQVTMPVASPTYLMWPIQPNDKGLAMPASFYLGGVSGLGGGTANDVPRGNLSALYWQPIGNKSFTTPDANSVVIRGPNGVRTQDIGGGTVSTLTPGGLNVTSASGSITLSAGGKTLVINSSGITIDGILWETHYHGDVASGTENTGPPA
jgi:hypothetical protein